mmetsp:Transcript_19116/g.53292  ORF Transcript_19116/g.53292 Transcript_19116/m.53292 type:complete len:208 (+) Transcript_19116:86-709(+)|eukprot:CAMPEP_0117668490 /NCGR_PEP_ID=MMETSP0804-20121206/11579_1 /TAXON_ID=1074897 /ORGANISM="Tetraselmis astigmatica, Strain CCMP880" /LENGTH=207 /DNA_ID=CAMNT_0005476389 /DNA_START=50 /DNA_END=673 /DNA_ORIENTATION=-
MAGQISGGGTVAHAKRMDVFLERPESQECFSELRIGVKLRLDPAEQTTAGGAVDRLRVCDVAGNFVGWVSAASLSQGGGGAGSFQAPPYTATVRTVWHCKETKSVNKVQIRVMDSPPEEPQPDAPKTEEEDDEWCLGKEQLQLIGSSSAIRNILRDERLQAVIRKIDSSSQREQDLEAAMSQDPAFREFCNQVLSVATPEEPAPFCG